ncbi:MAG: metallophosphoesterase [Sphingomonas bacterium]|jgi:Icc protein|nr:metallophosphoesterase [Sphingomonas bacterium]
MLVAQITDIHLGFEPDNVAEFNRKRLDQVLHSLCELDRRPDLLLATGDLVDRGDLDSYQRLRSALEGCPFPVWPCLGNHDVRDNFSAVFPEIPVVDGFVQYVVETGPVRFVILDTLEEGRHGGAYCETRARWLADTLARARDRPTVIVMHHPPFETGIEWMTTHADEPWVGRLKQALAGHDQIIGVVCGHIHRTIVTGWAGYPLIVCPSTAPQVALTLAPIDPDRADLRPMIIADPPAYGLHYWTGTGLVSHFDTADAHVVIARYDERMKPLVRDMIEERPAG